MKSSTRDQAAGNAKSIAGQIKETTGKLVGNPRLQAAGKVQRTEGRLQKKVGKMERVLGR